MANYDSIQTIEEEVLIADSAYRYSYGVVQIIGSDENFLATQVVQMPVETAPFIPEIPAPSLIKLEDSADTVTIVTEPEEVFITYKYYKMIGRDSGTGQWISWVSENSPDFDGANAPEVVGVLENIYVSSIY